MTTALPTDGGRGEHGEPDGPGAPSVELPPFVLPPSRADSGGGSRSRRARHAAGRHRVVGGRPSASREARSASREARPAPPSRPPRPRRGRILVRLGAFVATLVVVAAAVFAVRGTPSSENAHVTTHDTTRSTAVPPGSRAASVLVQTAPDGSATSITLLTGDRKGNDHVVFVPVGTMTEVPAFGLEAVGKAGALGGPALLRATLENLLGISVDSLVTVDDAAMGALVRPAGDLRVDVPDRVEEVAADGKVTVRWDAGPNLVGPEDIGALLRVKGGGNDLARLARQQAFWQAWLAKLHSTPAAVPARGADQGLRPVLELLAARAPAYDVLPVEAVDAGGGDELYRVRQDELEALIKQAAPTTPAAGTGRVRVQVLNGTGAVGLAQQVTLKLVQPSIRARVLYTGNADRFDYEETQVVFYDRNERATAQKVRDALGVGRLVLSRRPIGIVDVTVVVGRDFR